MVVWSLLGRGGRGWEETGDMERERREKKTGVDAHLVQIWLLGEPGREWVCCHIAEL